MLRVFRLAVGTAIVAALAAVAGVTTAAASVTPTFSAGNVATCGGSSRVTVRIDAQNPPPLQQAADIVLLVDRSGSIGTSAFAQVRSSLSAFITSAAPSASGNHIGIVGFSTGAQNITTGLLSNEATLQSIVTSMPYTGGNTYTLDGLTAAEAMLSGSGRPGAPKVIVVETDGLWNPSAQNPTTYAAGLVGGGTTIFAVGVGPGVNPSDLQAIAGGDASHVFSVSDYNGLQDALESALAEAVPAATSLSYSATPTADWVITGASASAGTATFTPGGVSWSLASINSATPTSVTISYTEQHVGLAGGPAVPLASSATLNYTDDTGAAQSVDYSAQTVAVDGCNRPPTANAGPDQSVALNGSHSASVSLDGSASSDPDNDPLTYTWTENGNTVATGAQPTVSLGIGTHNVTLTVDDGQYTSSDDVVITVYDPSPPVVTANVAGTLGNNGWYTSNAVVSFTVSDPESDIASTSADCAGATVSADTTGQTFTCTATSAGGSSSASVTVKRDATPPSVVFGGNAGTYHLGDTVAITCTASDAMSGLATPSNCGGASGPAWTFAGGVNTLDGTATDNAGNTTNASTTFTVVVDAAGLCALIKQWSDNAGVANSLCVKLDKNNMRPFWNELAAQRGKHIPADKADIILALSREL